MSEDDRAAKAARAKAMLKKRQAKKVGATSASTTGVTSPISERAFSPAPSEVAPVPNESGKRDISDVFVQDDNSDTSWLSSLPKASSPPPALPPTSVPPFDTSNPTSSDFVDAVTNELRLKEEIALLKERSTLLRSQIDGLESERAELNRARLSVQSENDSLKTELAQLHSTRSAAAAENNTLRADLARLETAKSDWSQREASLNVDVETFRVALAQVEASKSNLQRTEANLKAENKNIKSTLGEAETARAKSQQSESALKAQLDRLRSDLTEKLEDTTSRLKQTEGELMENRRKFQELEQQMDQLRQETEISLQNERQTISLLVSEKATLSSDLERLSSVELHAQEIDRLYSEERQRTASFEGQLHQLRVETQESTIRIQSLETTEKELREKVKEQERQVQLSSGSLTAAKKEAEKSRRRVKELEEQIQSDDRAERLEASLKNTQDRADELEFQLSKLKQGHAALRSASDELEARVRLHSESENEWKAKHSELHGQHQSITEQLAQNLAEKDSLSKEKTVAQSEVEHAQQALALLQDKLINAASELAVNTRHLQAAQNEAKIASRRAENAESAQKELQEDGTNLMRSLDEMRLKIVQLTGDKLELTEKTNVLEHVIRNRETAIARLESSLEDMKAKVEASEKRVVELVSQKDKEQLTAQDSEAELQKAYSQLQAEHDSALTSVKTLETDRTVRQHEVIQSMEEVERLQDLSSAQAEELLSLRQELSQRRNDQSEGQNLLDGAQNEIETLRQELATKDEELERLLARTSNSSAFPDQMHSLEDELNDEVLNSLKLDLSSSQSHIRSLEESLFEAEARSHALMKQVAALEDQLTMQSQSSAARPPSRPSSRASKGQIPQSHKPSVSALARSAIEHNLSAETRHKRKASLSMLKARIDSELAAAHFQTPSRALSPVQSEASNDKASIGGSISPPYRKRRPQFLDESHVFWCSSCRGDLVVL